MLSPGTPVRHFTLPDHTGAPVHLRDLLAAGPTVLFFYPGDFSPACSAQACLFRDMHDLAHDAGLVVAGINSAPPRLHALFHSTLHLPYRLLSDRGKRVARAYDALGPLGLFSRRVTYFISPDGVVRDALHASLRLSRHREFMRRAIERAGGDASGI